MKVRIYYNMVYVTSTPYEIYEGCPFVDIEEDEAEGYAEHMLDSGLWDAYLIPAFTEERIIFDQD